MVLSSPLTLILEIIVLIATDRGDMFQASDLQGDRIARTACGFTGSFLTVPAFGCRALCLCQLRQ